MRNPKTDAITPDQTENSTELNERLSESSSTAPASEDSSSNEVAVNYTISSPLRKTFRSSVEKNEDDTKISATFTLSPPPKANNSSISLLANRLEKSLDLESDAGNSVTATINVPLIPNKNTIGLDLNDKLKKTDSNPTPSQRIPPVPQPRSLFDIDNASSVKLADKIQSEAKKCDTVSDGPLSELTELPPSPIHHTIFGERRPSWRPKCDYSSKVNDRRSLHTHCWCCWWCTIWPNLDISSFGSSFQLSLVLVWANPLTNSFLFSLLNTKINYYWLLLHGELSLNGAQLILKFFCRSSMRNHLDRVTHKQHRLPQLTERLKIHSKPQTYHPSLDSTLPRMFLPRKRRLWHQIDPMTTKVGDAWFLIATVSANGKL